MLNRNGRSNKSEVSVPRLVIVLVLFCIICAAFVARLLFLQVADTETYEEISNANKYKTAVLSAQRGEIYDRNGKKFVSNVISYNIEINRTTLATGASYDILSKLIAILNVYGIEIPDSCPLTYNLPYQLDASYIFESDKTNAFNKFLKKNDKKLEDVTGVNLYLYLIEKYGIPEEEADSPVTRKIVGIRYDMELNDFSVNEPYILLKDVSEKIVTEIFERKHELHGIEISKSYSRKYDMNSVLCHVLGKVGPIYAEEAEEYIKEKGYPYDAIIGKDGAEKYFEEYLRGIDGTIGYEIDENNDIVGYEAVNEPKEGYSVRLTIDAELQKIVEDSLAEQISIAVANSKSNGGHHSGEDCDSGAAVVVDVDTGETLVLASCPGYDLNTFTENYNVIKADPALPQLNRAVQGIYPPGSTFKMLTAAAALDTGTVNAGTYIEDRGIYTKYAPTYTPRCWIFLRNGGTHGKVNVTDALKFSCNYYFYTIADMLGVDTIVKYASDFGLGVKTGIEIPESEGILASPAYKESIGYVWNPGDTLQMSIGQSDNAFTPLQLAMYMSAVVNGGNRYKATIFKSVDEYYTGIPVTTNSPVILSKTNLSDETVGIIKYAMKSVVDEEGGTAQGVFGNKPYANDIGGKTGTAQVSNGSDTVLFVGFAPYEKPEIAVAVVIENGYQSARAANVAAKVFDYYFENMKNDENTEQE